MSTAYTGNPATFPATIQIPDDGDAENAASVNVAFEGLADQTANIRAHSPRLRTLTITATTLAAWTAPPRVTAVTLEMCGGGGGSGGGGGGTPPVRGTGGAGGGGAQMVRVTVPVVPGTSYDVVIGAGGAGGAGGGLASAAGIEGVQGSDTTVGTSGGGSIAVARGGGQGKNGVSNGPAFSGILSAGGLPSRGGYRPPPLSAGGATAQTQTVTAPGSGGDGIGTAAMNARPGMSNAQYNGGSGGAYGPFGNEGGGGGGGGAGGGGNGGAGAINGTAAVSGAPNSGAGGGGGGGAGETGAFVYPGSPGGSGGSGFCRFIWAEETP